MSLELPTGRTDVDERQNDFAADMFQGLYLAVAQNGSSDKNWIYFKQLKNDNISSKHQDEALLYIWLIAIIKNGKREHLFDKVQ